MPLKKIYCCCSPKDIANLKNEIEKRQKESESQPSENHSLEQISGTELPETESKDIIGSVVGTPPIIATAQEVVGS